MNDNAQYPHLDEIAREHRDASAIEHARLTMLSEGLSHVQGYASAPFCRVCGGRRGYISGTKSYTLKTCHDCDQIRPKKSRYGA